MNKSASRELVFKLLYSLEIQKEFDLEQFMLFVGSKYYVATTRFNSSFMDLGNLYETSYFGENKTINYNLIFDFPVILFYFS